MWLVGTFFISPRSIVAFAIYQMPTKGGIELIPLRYWASLSSKQPHRPNELSLSIFSMQDKSLIVSLTSMKLRFLLTLNHVWPTTILDSIHVEAENQKTFEIVIVFLKWERLRGRQGRERKQKGKQFNQQRSKLTRGCGFNCERILQLGAL